MFAYVLGGLGLLELHDLLLEAVLVLLHLLKLLRAHGRPLRDAGKG